MSAIEAAGALTDVPGVLVGHATDLRGMTGCTVVLCPRGTVGGVEVRGGAPGTRETDALRPGTLAGEVHAVLLTGGSAFGLAAADGVSRWLEARGVGFDTGFARVPIVPAAVLFDLGIGDPAARPGPDDGAAACEAAAAGAVAEGTVGAGTGATVAKMPDPAFAVKGGIGTAAIHRGPLVVGAIVAVNAVGEILGEDGRPIAANRAPAGTEPTLWRGTNTTLVVVATNARLTTLGCARLAAAAHDGIARAIAPAHTLWDGDTAFALATGEVEASPTEAEGPAAEAVTIAIRRAVRLAEGIGGVPSVGPSEGEHAR
jgi:L-aminopeptidase/D-esterase-like protein